MEQKTYYKVVHQEEDGRFVSIWAGRHDWSKEHQSLEYQPGAITYMPKGTAGVYVFETLERCQQQAAQESKTAVAFEATGLGDMMPADAGNSTSPSFPAILLGKEVWRQKLLLLEEPKSTPIKGEKIEFRGFSGEKVEIIKQVDAGFHHDHLHIIINGENVGYFHILDEILSFWPPDGVEKPYGNQLIRLE